MLSTPPLLPNNEEKGPIAKAFGSYADRISKPGEVVNEVLGTEDSYPLNVAVIAGTAAAIATAKHVIFGWFK